VRGQPRQHARDQRLLVDGAARVAVGDEVEGWLVFRFEDKASIKASLDRTARAVGHVEPVAGDGGEVVAVVFQQVDEALQRQGTSDSSSSFISRDTPPGRGSRPAMPMSTSLEWSQWPRAREPNRKIS